MGGVDKNDQFREYYHVRLKNKKYYKYLVWMIDVAITNMLILARTNPALYATTTTVTKFRATLARELLDGYFLRKRRGRRPTVCTKRFKGSQYYPLLGDGKQHRCHYCFSQGIRKDAKWYCKECNMYLFHNGHDNECFLVYHLNYVWSPAVYSLNWSFTFTYTTSLSDNIYITLLLSHGSHSSSHIGHTPPSLSLSMVTLPHSSLTLMKLTLALSHNGLWSLSISHWSSVTLYNSTLVPGHSLHLSLSVSLTGPWSLFLSHSLHHSLFPGHSLHLSLVPSHSLCLSLSPSLTGLCSLSPSLTGPQSLATSLTVSWSLSLSLHWSLVFTCLPQFGRACLPMFTHVYYVYLC